MKNIYLSILFIVFFASANLAIAQTDADSSPLAAAPNREKVFAETQRVEGKVVGVHDGDTCTVLDANKRQHKIRFNGIDAPELKQDFGNRAKQNLSDLIFGKTVTVVYDKLDKYGRTVGTVFVNGVDANLEQIKGGFAWHYKKYESEQTPEDRTKYAAAEAAARAARVGIWSQGNIVPPWDYRGEVRERQAENRANRQYLTGAKGGCYYLNSSGKKTYVDKRFCGGATNAAVNTPARQVSSGGRTYIRGPKGGCYYLNSSGRKTYVDKDLCN